jgi:hypothetical protein
MARRLVVHALALAVVLACAATARADPFDSSDTLAAIEQASSSTGVAQSWLYRVIGCETGWTFNPHAVGDRGTSLGPAQLHRGGGELPRFYAFGYSDPFDPYQSIEFMALEFADGRARAWSCR